MDNHRGGSVGSNGRAGNMTTTTTTTTTAVNSAATTSTEEEYMMAQRAAVESVYIGRETLNVAVRQGEQLDRAVASADETQYSLDKANRVLRGMTWSGWMANMFTSDVRTPQQPASDPATATATATAPSRDNKSTDVSVTTAMTTSGWKKIDLSSYDSVPDCCRDAAQSIRNYHLNVTVLEACETEDQKKTCQVICDQMYQTAVTQLESLRHGRTPQEQQINRPDGLKVRTAKDLSGYVAQFTSDLKALRVLQLKSQSRTRQLGVVVGPTGGGGGGGGDHANRNELFGTAAATSTSSSNPSSSQAVTAAGPVDSELVQRQDEHLETLSQSLNELGTIAQSLNEAVKKQNDTIETIDDKTDHMYEKARMVTRRAERLIRDKSWNPAVSKHEFVRSVTFRHVNTGRYLGVVNQDVYLLPQLQSTGSCAFDVHKRKSSGNTKTASMIFGLKNQQTDKWVGQTFFGTLSCSAASFGRREEWEANVVSSPDGNGNDHRGLRRIKTATNPPPGGDPSIETGLDWLLRGGGAASATEGDGDPHYVKLLCASAGWGSGGYVFVRPKDLAVQIGANGVDASNAADVWCVSECPPAAMSSSQQEQQLQRNAGEDDR